MSHTSHHSDLDQFRRIQTGDIEAYSEVFRRLYSPLCFFAERYLHDFQASQGIVQDVFVRFWESRASLNIQSSLKSYLYAAVRNACLNQIKHDDFSTSLDDEVERPGHESSQPDVAAEAAELSEAVEKAVAALAPRCRQIFSMAKYDGMTYEEIAQVLGISINTVKTQLKRALKTLGRALLHFQIVTLLLLKWW